MIILIPALKPDEKLLNLIDGLLGAGFQKIVIVNDGSPPEYDMIFEGAEKKGCTILRHAKNLGKGAAIKNALAEAIRLYGPHHGFITADADGQHLIGDICRVADGMASNPQALVLGVRNFDTGNVPLGSLAGNRITSVFFRLITGVSCGDTQTGLRGIPECLIPLALTEEGERYEYEMNFLVDAVRKAPLKMIPIETVYENGNKGSHFRPVADSLLIYGRLVRYAFSSLAGAAVDFLLFCLFTAVFPFSQLQNIYAATIFARIGSGIVNFFLNRHWSFKSRNPAGGDAARYFALFLFQMCVSAAAVAFLASVSFPTLAAKIIVDTALFFFSFMMQQSWVFGQGENHEKYKEQ